MVFPEFEIMIHSGNITPPRFLTATPALIFRFLLTTGIFTGDSTVTSSARHAPQTQSSETFAVMNTGANGVASERMRSWGSESGSVKRRIETTGESAALATQV